MIALLLPFLFMTATTTTTSLPLLAPFAGAIFGTALRHNSKKQNQIERIEKPQKVEFQNIKGKSKLKTF